jgi:putative zinc finger protein
MLSFWRYGRRIAPSQVAAIREPVMGTLPKTMNCKDTIRLMCEYIEGRLTPAVAQEVRAHVGRCENCRMVLEAAERTLEVYFDETDAASPFLVRSTVA